MANFLRMLLGLCLLPLCWAVGRSFVDAVSAVGTGEGMSGEMAAYLPRLVSVLADAAQENGRLRFEVR